MNWFMMSFIPAACAALVVFVIACLIFPPLAPVAAILTFIGAL